MLNHVVLMGRLTADPEIRYTPNNVAVASYTLAVERSYSSQGEQRKADFIDCTSWRQQAEFVSKYFRKGQLVAVEGAIQTDSYTDNQGIKRKRFEIVADRVHFAESRNSSANNGQAYASVPQVQASGVPAVQQPAPTFAVGDAGDFQEISSDDDLPF